MPSSPHIRILMCTRNGAEYLQAQLDSFLTQSHADWSLWISDDGSTDTTGAILKAFRTRNPGRDIRIFDGPGQGAAANFLSLMERCPAEPGGLVALSDQDDVWLPEKLARAAAAIAAAPGAGQGRWPVAYATAQILSDARLNRRRPSRPVRTGPSFGNALVQNILSGNSLVLNPAMLALVQRTLPPRGVPSHDWWIYQIVTGAGGQAIYDSEPSLIYRQHRTNTLGGNRGIPAIRYRMAMVWEREYIGWIRANVAALQAAGDALTPQNRALLHRFADGIGQGGLRRPRLLRQLGVRRQNATGAALTSLLATLGRV